jgi:hypothetical protein
LNFSKYQKKISLKYLIGLSVAVLIGILFFGLRPKDFNFSNDVTWITGQPGIRFSGYGMAYTDPIKELTKEDDSGKNGFSVEIALKPASYHKDGFNFILALHNGKDSNQLLVGQWHSSIIIMNGDDYNHRRRTKRIAVELTAVPPTTRFLTITTGKDGTSIYLDGRLNRTKRDLTLKIPDGGNSRLLLGNSVYGKHSWEGDVYGLAFYRNTLTDQDVAMHFDNWAKYGNFLFVMKYKPFVVYLFNEKGGKRAFDHAGEKYDLEIPSRMQILDKNVLSLTWNRLNFDSRFIRDIIINLIGFIPLGFFLNATFVKAGGSFKRHGVLITIVLCFTVSLSIETLQAWMPSRSSDCLDLVLNTLGALLGVMIFRFLLTDRGLGSRGQGFRKKEKV